MSFVRGESEFFEKSSHASVMTDNATQSKTRQRQTKLSVKAPCWKFSAVFSWLMEPGARIRVRLRMAGRFAAGFRPTAESVPWRRFRGIRRLAPDKKTRQGFSPINRAHVKSAASGSSDRTMRPRVRADPFSGPLPSIAMIPSAITKWTGTAALISRMLRSIPFQCRMSLASHRLLPAFSL